jgi:hypothetical protein
MSSTRATTRTKATVTLDRAKVDVAKQLIGAASMSDVIAVALDRLIATETLQRDIAAYEHRPQTASELAIADLPVTFDLADDDVDYDALYGEQA